MDQIVLDLPEIDFDATKKAVEKALETYRMFILTEPIEKLPKVTQTFSLVPPTRNNAFHSSTEDAAVLNLDREMMRRGHINKIQNAVNRLGFLERAIIIKRYMSQDNVFDYEVYNDLHLSERKYYRIKSRAFYKLALALKIEVYKEANEK